jgi:RNA recognition motif-containing protein
MGSKLYVGNLSYDTNEETLRAAFAEAGTVKSVSILIDRDTGRSRGFGFVEMGSDADAQNAIKNLDGRAIDGRNIRVKEARDKPRPEGGRGGGPPRGRRDW